jgi:peroxiredoxin Q/BCP
MVQEGQQAPDFELETYGGETVKLSDYRGQRVVLFFYPKDDTSGCTKEACGFRDTMDPIQAENAVVMGVSPDGVTSHQKFRDKHDLNFPLLADTDHSVAEAYGAWGLKKMYGREYQGILRSTFVIGADGTVEKVYAKVKPAEHAQQVLSDLQAQG